MYYRSKKEQAERLTEEMLYVIERFNYAKSTDDYIASLKAEGELTGLITACLALDIPVRVRHDKHGFIYRLHVMDRVQDIQKKEKEND